MLRDEDLIELVARITPQWVAGFFDGEGCVSISPQRENPDNFRMQVKITQKDTRVLALIMLKFPGGSFVPRVNAADAYWYSSNAEDLLNSIKDYVVVKKRQVEAALEFISLLGTPTVALAKTNLERRKELHDLVKEENKH